MTNQEYIDEVAKYVKKHAPQYNIKVYSPVIAQFCLESGYGTTNKVKAVLADGTVDWRHNYVGLKWRNNRCAISNDYFEEGTAEQNPDGSYVGIVSRFYRFKSLEDCVIGYFQFTNISTYANLKGVEDAYQYLCNIKSDGYATSLEYVQKCMNVIEKWDLTKYDDKKEESVVTQNNTTGFVNVAINGIKVNTSYPCNANNYGNAASRNIKYIVVHYTGNNADTALNNVKYFQGSGRRASAHFFVDDISIYQSVELRDTAWHCGTSGAYAHAECRNANSIGIEMCCSGNYIVSEKTKENAIYLCAYLCKTIGINANEVDQYVLRHYDVTNKSCPKQMAGANNAEWTKFKSDVKKVLGGQTVTNTTTTSTPSSTTSLNTGDEIKLSNTPVYSNATIQIATSKKTGTFYVWSYAVNSGRIRITNAKNRVGVSGQITGWVNISDIIGDTTTNNSSTTETKYWRVQAGAYLLKSGAEKLQKELKVAGFDAIVKKVGVYYKVQLGAYSNKTGAENLMARVAAKGFKAILIYN